MPVGLLGLESPVDSDPLIPQREERGGQERRMMDGSRDLGSCETSIKINRGRHASPQRQGSGKDAHIIV